MASRTEARFSTYSGAPSLQPSLAPTFETQNTSARSRSRMSQRTSTINERMPYRNTDPSVNASSSTLSTTDPRSQDLKAFAGFLDRMQDGRLDKQRYEMTSNKSEEVSKLALGAKVERALARRMTAQDAQFTNKKALDIEKRSLEVEAN
ncbi:hypothetical protein BAUCODRAFT_35827 [Baudoinia panamericana UAMH 10762]|uniref:Uncharacterized protein n=1 Tax=Baudoinia panamericana (strain UAMH 10762) TaxID=717646 RepID=M2MDI6_BAUPA|nr:uncharacterized protein BAUCODRAFT_35827 [Baudoinia panamericana UAMH 10762]EMC94596.1 hypothetical protein BAUCODRAFT_35827 [Baudoinia panamericana UAMH 10762]